MGNNYNIKRNVPEPSSEDIKKFMDFDALLAAHRTAETPREEGVVRNFTSPREGQLNARMRRWILGGASLATAAAVALLLIVRSLGDLPTPEQSQAVADAYFAAQPLVNPPIEQAEPTRQVHHVNAAEGATLELEAGARMVIPRTAFQTDRGTLIESGEVDIYYRELHDAVDFFMAGVPMSYDSAGQRHYLQPAGMIEVIAMQNGQRVGMAPGKSIRIELQSSVSPLPDGSWPNFKVYYLDSMARNWQYRGSSTMAFIDASMSISSSNGTVESKIEAEKAALLAADPAPISPLKPIKPDGKAISFDLDLKKGEIQIEAGSEAVVAELGNDDNVWQVLPNCPPFNPADLNLGWQSVRLSRAKDGGYDMTLLSGNTKSLRLLVQPVMTNSDYLVALKQYNDALATYEKQLEEWEKRHAEKLAALEERLKQEQNLGKVAPSNALNRKVRHIFDINAFGIWNCDRPAPLAQQSFRIRVIEDQFGNTFPNQTAYLSEPDGQSIYQVHTGRGSTVHFDTDKEYLLWMLTPEGKIALLKTKAEWAQSNPRKGVKLKVHTSDQSIRSEADMRRALNPN